MASLITRFIATLSLMLLGATSAWAGRGDIDTNYGEGGQLAAPPGVLLALPGDRLVIADGGTGEGFRLRMVDATGQNVPSFGDGGVVLIDSLAAERNFSLEAAALAPNGDMIFAGSLAATQARGLLRLNSDGQPVLSFGDRGDGFIEPAVTTQRAMAVAVDSDGKIVLLDGSREPGYDDVCGSPARLQRLLADGQPDTGFGGGAIIEIPDLDICNGASVYGARADGGIIVGDGHTIVAFDAAGDIDPTFGVDGRLIVSELNEVNGMLLPDGGLLIFGSSDEGAAVFLKFDRNGQPDLDFGAGTGSVTVDLGAPLGEPSARAYIEQLALDPDGEHVIAELSLTVSGGNGYGRVLCSGIARLTIDGSPDADFGRNGVTCLNFDLALLAVQGDGAPLFTGFDGAIRRLLPDNSPSPGLLRLVATGSSRFAESVGTVTVAIERLAGRDGAASVNVATVYRRGSFVRYPGDHTYSIADSATAGSDYTATSGRLDWASGDESQRTVIVSILDDDAVENFESFGIDFSEPGGGVQLIGSRTTVLITDDDAGSTTPPPPTSGGGGLVSWATPLALLGLLFMRRRRVNRY